MEKMSKAVLAGMMIGFGGIVYSMSDNKVFGAFLFSFGLLSVLLRNYRLFTGWVAWAEPKDFIDGCMMLDFNLIGATIAGVLCHTWIAPLDTLITIKLSQPLWETFVRAMGCGVCMYLAVSGYRNNKSIISVIMGVMVFILAGFEHCIADMFYFAAGNEWSFKAFLFIITAIAGNAIGAQFVRRFSEFKSNKGD